jgi:hypothetical protein
VRQSFISPPILYELPDTRDLEDPSAFDAAKLLDYPRRKEARLAGLRMETHKFEHLREKLLLWNWVEVFECLVRIDHQRHARLLHSELERVKCNLAAVKLVELPKWGRAECVTRILELYRTFYGYRELLLSNPSIRLGQKLLLRKRQNDAVPIVRPLNATDACIPGELEGHRPHVETIPHYVVTTTERGASL